jgi:hypothetical protein
VSSPTAIRGIDLQWTPFAVKPTWKNACKLSTLSIQPRDPANPSYSVLLGIFDFGNPEYFPPACGVRPLKCGSKYLLRGRTAASSTFLASSWSRAFKCSTPQCRQKLDAPRGTSCSTTESGVFEGGFIAGPSGAPNGVFVNVLANSQPFCSFVWRNALAGNEAAKFRIGPNAPANQPVTFNSCPTAATGGALPCGTEDNYDVGEITFQVSNTRAESCELFVCI